MSKAKTAENKLRLAVLAAMPYPTPQGSQIFIGSLVYALKNAGYQVSFHTYPITDGRLTGEPGPVADGPLDQLMELGGQVADQLGLGGLAGDIKNQLNNLGNLFPSNILRSGPSVTKVEQDVVLFKNTLGQLTAERPDLLYVHNYEALAMGLPLGMMLGVPVLYHAHNVMSQELPTYFKNFQSKLLALMGGKALDFLPALANQLLFFSQQQIELLEGRIIAEEKINIIPPGLLAKEPEDLFWNKENGGPAAGVPPLPKEPFFLYTGNCDAYQNMDLLAKALDLVGYSIPHKLLLCTSSPIPEKLQKHPKIICQPMVGNQQLKQLLATATALVVPRQATFGFPIKVLQAMRVGLPVIGLRSSLSQLLLEHEALLIDNNANAMATAMIRLAENPALRSRLSRQSRQTFEQRFTLEKQVKLYDTVFKKCCQK